MERNKELQDMHGYNLVTTTDGQLRGAYRRNSEMRKSFGMNEYSNAQARSSKAFDGRKTRSFDR